MDRFDEALAQNETRIKRITNMLIIDHNTFRFHTYDMICALLLSKAGLSLSAHLTEDFKNFLKCETWLERAIYVKSYLKNLDFCEVFDIFERDPGRYIRDFEEFLKCEYQAPDQKHHVTHTQLWANLNPVLERSDISVSVLRHKYETYDIRLPRKTKFYTTTNLWSLKTLRDIIGDLKVNAVVIDSAEFAAQLAAHFKDITFIFGEYRYNYRGDIPQKFGTFRSLDLLLAAQNQNNDEFGTFDPYFIETKGVIDNAD